MTFLKVAPSPGGDPLKNGGTSNEPAPSSSQPSPSSPPHQRRSAELTASFTLEANSFVSEAGTSIASMERRESIGRPEMHRVFLWFATEEREHDYSQQMSDARIERIGAEAPAYAALSLVVCATCAADAWLAAGGVPTSALVVVIAWVVGVALLVPLVCMPWVFGDTPQRGVLLIGVATAVPVVLIPVAALCAAADLNAVHRPGGPTDATAIGRQMAALQAALCALAALPAMLLHLPLRAATLPSAVAAVLYIGAYVAAAALVPGCAAWSEVACRSVALLVLLGLLAVGTRHNEALERAQFLMIKDMHDDVRKNVPAAVTLSRSVSRARLLSRSMSRVGMQTIGAELNISSPLETALQQLRNLAANTENRGGAPAAELAMAIKMLERTVEKSAEVGGFSSTFDWKRELGEAGVDDEIGEWLKATLSQTHQREGRQDSWMKLPLEDVLPQGDGPAAAPHAHKGSRRPSLDHGGVSFAPVQAPSGATATATATTLANVSDRKLAAFQASQSASRRGSAASLCACAEATTVGQLPAPHAEVPAPSRHLLDMIESHRPSVRAALDDWGVDHFAHFEASGGHAMLLFGEELLERYDLLKHCHIDKATLRRFLLHMEAHYGQLEDSMDFYHNSVHGTDVLHTTHLLLSSYGLVGRLSKFQLLASLIAAIIHDFNHPGTNNAHEVKIQSARALTYSDQSPLEHHHLASAFAALANPELNIFKGLSKEEYRPVRALIIELVLHTDLAKHFDFIGRLKALSSTKGHAVHEARQPKEPKSHHEAMEILKQRASADDSSPNAPTRPSGEGESGREGDPLPDSSPPSKPAAPEKQKSRVGFTGRRSSIAPPETETGSFQETSTRKQARRRMDGRRSSDGSIFENFGAVAAAKPWRSPFLDEDVDVRLILGTAIKFADLGHAVKPYALHTNWSIRISKEFWELGDREVAMGVPISPLCDRDADKNIAKSQLGFFKFICNPFFQVVADLVDPRMAQYAQLQENYASWQVRVDQGESFSQPNTPGGSNRGKSPGADQLGADTIVSDADDQSFASKNNESPPPPRLAQPRAAAALTEEA